MIYSQTNFKFRHHQRAVCWFMFLLETCLLVHWSPYLTFTKFTFWDSFSNFSLLSISFFNSVRQCSPTLKFTTSYPEHIKFDWSSPQFSSNYEHEPANQEFYFAIWLILKTCSDLIFSQLILSQLGTMISYEPFATFLLDQLLLSCRLAVFELTMFVPSAHWCQSCFFELSMHLKPFFRKIHLSQLLYRLQSQIH